MHKFLLALSLAFAGPGALSLPAVPAAAQPAQAWEIGPNIRGRAYSVGMPAHPAPAGRGGWTFDFPYPHRGAGHVHYVTFDPGSLAGKSRIAVRYRVEAARGVRFVPQQTPDAAATVSIVLQRRGDTWSGRGAYEFFRWYAPGGTVRQLAPGEYEMVVDLRDGGWTSVQGRPASQFPGAFADAIADTGRLGLVFGSTSLRGHGVFATGPARFTMVSLRIL